MYHEVNYDKRKRKKEKREKIKKKKERDKRYLRANGTNTDYEQVSGEFYPFSSLPSFLPSLLLLLLPPLVSSFHLLPFPKERRDRRMMMKMRMIRIMNFRKKKKDFWNLKNLGIFLQTFPQNVVISLQNLGIFPENFPDWKRDCE